MIIISVGGHLMSVEAIVWVLLAILGVVGATYQWQGAEAERTSEVESRSPSRTRLLLARISKRTASTRLWVLVNFLAIGLISLFREPRNEARTVGDWMFSIVFEGLMFAALVALDRAIWLDRRDTRVLYGWYGEE